MATFETPERKAKIQEKAEKHLERLDTMRLYTLTELEPILGVTHRTLQQYVKDKKIKAVKVGGKWKVSEENLRKFINGD